MLIKRKKTLNKPKNKRHLDINKRITIQTMLDNQKTPYVIAGALGKSASTIVREIKNHTKVIPAIDDCTNYYLCKIKNLCNLKYCRKVCKKCDSHDCHRYCKSYEKGVCERLQKSPHVCNGCDMIHNCYLEHRLYKAIDAQQQYEAMLVDKRIGFDLSEQQLSDIDKMVSPLIMSGHSPYATMQELGEQLPCSEATLYRLIDKGLLECRNIDLQERVKRKPRKHTKMLNKDAYAILSEAKKGHLWSDYLEYLKAHDITAVQLDCVEGKKEDEAVILTLHWPRVHMQLYFIMDKHDAEHVVKQFDILEQALGLELFQEMFPAILTDNGHEFTDIEGIEKSCTVPGKRRTTVFFCEPNRSDEKGHCERNHRLLRKIIPKGTSIEPYSQADMNLITNHVNSYVRKSLGGISPYNLAMEEYDEDFFILLGLETIPYDEVNLTPSLLTKRKTA